MNITATEFLNNIDRHGRLIHPPKDVNGEPQSDWIRPSIPNELFKEIINQIDTTMRYSADVAFASSEFYQELPPMLQQGLVNSCLTGLYTHFRYFFDGLKSEMREENQVLIHRILTELDCKLYPVGGTILEKGAAPEQVYFIFKGEVALYDYLESPVYPRIAIDFMTLKEGSFFGELEAILG